MNMKYLLFFSTLIILISNGFAQENNVEQDSIKYSLNFSCNNKITKVKNYHLAATINDSIYSFISDSTGICTIPTNDSLTFRIYSGFGLFEIFAVKNGPEYSDTILLPPIYYAPVNTSLRIGPTYYAYFHCGTICDGLHKSYREDGVLWQKGRFKRGKLKKLIIFYPGGQIKSKQRSYFLYDCDIYYDNFGNIVRKSRRILLIRQFQYYDSNTNKYIKRLFLIK